MNDGKPSLSAASDEAGNAGADRTEKNMQEEVKNEPGKNYPPAG
jgi:hypothetical protein